MKFVRPKFKTVAICFVLFLFFLFVNFPLDNLRGQIFETIYKQTGIIVNAEALYISIFGWPGVGMKNVDVSIPSSVIGIDADVSAKYAVARVGLGGILPPKISYSISLSELKKGGSLFVKFVPGKSSHSVVLEADKLNLSQIPFRVFPEPMKGTLKAFAKVNLNAEDPAKTIGDLDLSVQELSTPAFSVQQDFGDGIQLSIPFPAMKIGPLKAVIPIRAGSASLNNVQIGKNDSDLTAAFTGDLRINKDSLQNFLSLNVQLQISEKLEKDPRSESLLSSINGMKVSDRKYSMKWNSSIYDMIYRGKGIPEIGPK